MNPSLTMRYLNLWLPVVALFLGCSFVYALNAAEGDGNVSSDLSVLKNWQAGAVVTAEMVESFGGLDACFVAKPIPDKVWKNMQGKSYKKNPYIGRDDLRIIYALHWDYDNRIHLGEMICNKKIAGKLVTILRKLYVHRYPIERMVLPDTFDSDESQMRANNSSCFCFRTIARSNNLSKHARGLAIDINPLYNPYCKKQKNGSLLLQPSTAKAYCNRKRDFPYKIERDDYCCRLFKEEGFHWGGDWKSCKDFQHFEYSEK